MNQLKVDEALGTIEDALYRQDAACVAFSGGKDSTVILDLIRKINPDIPALFANTGVEAKETRDFIKDIDNIFVTHYEKSFWECVEKNGFPTQKDKKGGGGKGNACCKYTKHRPMELWQWQNDIRLVFQGITVEESRQRWLRHEAVGHLYQKNVELPKFLTGTSNPIKYKSWVCHPIWNWTTEDVWAYIRENNLPYNKLYDNGAVRVGCVPCTAYISWRERLARENPKMLRVVLHKMGETQLEDFITV